MSAAETLLNSKQNQPLGVNNQRYIEGELCASFELLLLIIFCHFYIYSKKKCAKIPSTKISNVNGRDFYYSLYSFIILANKFRFVLSGRMPSKICLV